MDRNLLIVKSAYVNNGPILKGFNQELRVEHLELIKELAILL